MRMKILSISMFVLVLSSRVFAGGAGSHDYVWTLDNLVNASDIIVVGEVISIKKPIIGYNYVVVEAKKIIKGKNVRSDIKIMFGNLFSIRKRPKYEFRNGSKYVFFVKDFGHKYELAGNTFGYYLVDQNDMVDFYTGKVHLGDIITEIGRITSGRQGGSTAQ